ncbi:YceI family protein [Reichenbachiella agarivorans]|uniref:YceI family protein n=1 Tax=Reichenbachiella agarivorans TaxID=2979464 RepID=A0ABY6CRW5_9BACT|nr:YceI family protein [Reichenbachiella agarivorans]UXP33267.1 YceI family protein [Reichenbachiella agarivorans]
MLNALLVLLTFISFTEKETISVQADVSKSTVIWNATKVIGGGHTGTIILSEAKLDLKGSELKGGSFTADMTTINSTDLEGDWKAKLDGHLKSDDFFAVDKFKTATFKITKLKKTATGYDVTGDMTIKGKTVSVTFPATVTATGDTVTATAKITLDRTKFDVKYGSNSFFDSLGDKAISDEFTLDVTLVSGK